MAERSDARATNEYWGRDGLERAILEALAAAGKNIDALTIDDLAPSRPVPQRREGRHRAAGAPGRARDPACACSTSAAASAGRRAPWPREFGCHVTVVDLTESYVRAGRGPHRPARTRRARHPSRGRRPGPRRCERRSLRRRLDAEQRHEHRRQGAPLRGIRAACSARAGGWRSRSRWPGPVQPPIFPVMWARDATTSFLRSPAEMRAVMEAAGFVGPRTGTTSPRSLPARAAAAPAHSIQRIVMGDALEAITRGRAAQPRGGAHRQRPGRA